jgi:hypothetical protein
MMGVIWKTGQASVEIIVDGKLRSSDDAGIKLRLRGDRQQWMVASKDNPARSGWSKEKDTMVF